MNFSIYRILEVTAFIALLMASARTPRVGIGLCVIFVNAAAIVTPLLLGYWAILTAKQERTQLVLKNSGFAGLLLRFAYYCFVTSILSWIGFVIAVIVAMLS